MKKKFGFTLAEVLITLGIIGVVAALTTPALVKNSGQAKIGPSLAKFVNTFETACEQMLHNEDSSYLTGGEIITLSQNMIMTPFPGTYTFTDATGANPRNLTSREDLLKEAQEKYDECVSNGGDETRCNRARGPMIVTQRTLWQLKDGSVMIFAPRSTAIQANNLYENISKGAYRGIVAEILYDIDGDRGSNKAGKDVFSFLVDRTGILVPAGSNAHKFISTNTTKQKGTEFMTGFVDKSECDITSTELMKNLACTGAIADNSWKAEY